MSFSASSYTSSGNIGEKRWHLTEGIGSEKKMLEALPLTVSVDTSMKAVIQNPFVEYKFFNFNPAALAKVHVYTLPAFPLNNTYQMRYAVQVDEGELQILNFSSDGKGSDWSENVLRNNAIKTVMFPKLRAGKHKLRIYMIDPGVVLDKIFISLDNRSLPYSDTAETVPAMVGE